MDTREREEEHQNIDYYVKPLYTRYKGEGMRSIGRWTVMFNPCTLDTRGRGEEHQKMDCYV